MYLYLVQHGAATSKAEDSARPLTADGVRAVEAMARWAARATVTVAQIRHSGKRRAEETADLYAHHLKPPDGVRAVVGLGPTDDVEPVAAGLEGETEALMLVGHLPFLARLVGRLVAGDAERAPVRFTNAGIVCLRRDDGQWAIEWAVPPSLAR